MHAVYLSSFAAMARLFIERAGLSIPLAWAQRFIMTGGEKVLRTLHKFDGP